MPSSENQPVDYKRDLKVLLRVSLKLSPKKQEGALLARVYALNLGKTCSRCGGGGNFSYNSISGTTCFKCHGSGQTAPKYTKKILQSAGVAVDNGDLDKYLKELGNRKTAKDADKKIMLAWSESGIGGLYSWLNVVTDKKKGINSFDVRFSKINEIMFNQHKHISELSRSFFSCKDDGERCIKAAELVNEGNLALEAIASAAEGIEPIIMERINSPADVSQDKWFLEVFLYGCRKGNLEMVNITLDSGLSVDSKIKGEPLIVLAHGLGCLDAVRVLMERGASVDAFKRRNKSLHAEMVIERDNMVLKKTVDRKTLNNDSESDLGL